MSSDGVERDLSHFITRVQASHLRNSSRITQVKSSDELASPSTAGSKSRHSPTKDPNLVGGNQRVSRGDVKSVDFEIEEDGMPEEFNEDLDLLDEKAGRLDRTRSRARTNGKKCDIEMEDEVGDEVVAPRRATSSQRQVDRTRSLVEDDDLDLTEIADDGQLLDDDDDDETDQIGIDEPEEVEVPRKPSVAQRSRRHDKTRAVSRFGYTGGKSPRTRDKAGHEPRLPTISIVFFEDSGVLKIHHNGLPVITENFVFKVVNGIVSVTAAVSKVDKLI